MFAEMEIKSNHIKEAEAILINDNSFDEDERVPFIKNLETRDLLAVPGSGKTTALQAKLYCLAKQMPFEDRSGVLVLSHTNKAVEEIEKKLKNHCPQLFEYPHFVGTVQSFVNDFLTKPYYLNHNKYKIEIIDTDIYNNRLKKYALDTFVACNETKKLFRTPNIEWLYNFEIKHDAKNNSNYIIDRRSQEKIVFKNPKGNTKPKNYSDWSTKTKNKVQENLIRLKSDILKSGTLSFEDCYFYGNTYFHRCPTIKNIIQHRFKYIFIDEAQDLEKYQLDIIESIFNTAESNCIIQRIGDINQSIYSRGKTVKIECDWKPRNPIHLNTSLRLTKEVADVVDCFTLKKQFEHKNKNTHQFKVEGKNILSEVIPPHFIVFDNDTIGELKPKFEELIRQFNLFDGSKGEKTKRGYKIIGWNGTWKEEDSKGRLRLENIFPDEYRTAINSKTNKVKLCDYLVHNPKNRTLKKYQDDIIDALCTLLRSVGCMAKLTRKGEDIERHYTGQILWKSLIDESRKIDGKLSEQDVLDFKSNLYSWSFSIATNSEIENTYNEIVLFIKSSFSNWYSFNDSSTELASFIGDNFENVDCCESPNVTVDSIPIDICSIHSVKGQTHCATMYVETSYYNYETQKKQVVEALKRKQHKLLTSTSVKLSIQAFKMMYVGFSRPTHLLCFAVLKDNLSDEQLSYFKSNENGWLVIDLTEGCNAPE